MQLAVLLMASLFSSNSPMLKPPPGRGLRHRQHQPGSGRIQAPGQRHPVSQRALSSANPDVAATQQRVARVREDLDTLDKLTQQFQSINPLVLAAPFYAEAHNTAPINPSFTSYYAPGVLVLLLQHIAITLAALSMVRERLLGTVELFRVSPVRPAKSSRASISAYLLFSA